jgi:hypothetical protein
MHHSVSIDFIDAQLTYCIFICLYYHVIFILIYKYIVNLILYTIYFVINITAIVIDFCPYL